MITQAKSSTLWQWASKWTSTPASANQPSVDYCGNLAILTAVSDVSAVRQKRAIVRIIRSLPVTKTRLILDISQLDDCDAGIVSLVCDLVAEAQRCRLEVCVAGVSKTKLALFELTRLSQVTRCFRQRREAICALLVDESQKLDLVGRSEAE